MTEVQTTIRYGLGNGDTISLGDTVHGSNIEQSPGGLTLTALHSGEQTEHVILSTALEDGENFDQMGEVLAITDGVGTHGPPKAWMLVPVSEYGSDST